MEQFARTAGMALLAGSLVLGSALAGSAQSAMTGSQQSSLYQYALLHFDTETQTLATMRNHIPSREVVPVSVAGLRGYQPRRGGNRGLSRAQHAALEAALSKATVADQDRSNGQSEDQSSLAEYLQHLGVDPNGVVAVDIDPKLDRQNPRVTVSYRKR